ncbi:MAG: tetratricopeptide repeat protein [Dehalococcoidia bacterium]
MPSVPPRPRHLAILSLLVLSTIAACAATEPAASRAGAVAPRTAPEALGAGRALVHAGEWEAAAAALVEATADSGDAGLAARFELARLDYRMGNDAVAADRLAALLESPGRGPTLTSAWLLQGAVQIDLGRHDQALAAFGRYIELGGPAAAYARVEQARLLADTDAEAALATLRVVTDGPAPVHARRLALRLAAPLDEAAGRHERALAGYNELLRLSSWRSDRTFALARLGALQEQMGNLDGAADAFNRLVSQYPAGAEAEAALKSLSGMGRPANQLAAGLVHYRRRSDQAARDLFNAFLRANGSSGPGAATALFYLGALAERRGDTGMAVQNYAEAFDADPAGGLAAEALWERGNVLAEIGRRSEAREAYAQVAQRFPASGRAADAAFRAGYMLYTDGDPPGAGGLERSPPTSPMTPARRRSPSGPAGRQETGDSDGARALYATAVRRDPSGYYGLRAAAVLAGEPRAPAVGRPGSASRRRTGAGGAVVGVVGRSGKTRA